jgi:hypothetical protein
MLPEKIEVELRSIPNGKDLHSKTKLILIASVFPKSNSSDYVMLLNIPYEVEALMKNISELLLPCVPIKASAKCCTASHNTE